MRERKYVKLKCDMYEDTKFKIIDTMENRDTINYIWTRILALCGKVNNSSGDLVMSKGMIYTIEILALEFNRSKEQVEDAVNVFIELNMMSKDENGMLRVCNWGKHQGIKRADTIRKSEENEEKKEIKIKSNEGNIKSLKNQDNKSYYQDTLQNNHDKKEEKFKSVDKKIDNDKLIKIGKDLQKPKNVVFNIDDGIKEACADKLVKEHNKKKRRKNKIEEIMVTDSDGIDLVSCGVDIVPKDVGRVVKTFDIL